MGVVPAVLAIIFGIISVRRQVARTLAIAGITCGAMALVFGATILIHGLVPDLARDRELSRRELCDGNCNVLATGLVLYAKDDGDQMPPTLQASVQYLTKAGLAGDTVLQCPSAQTHKDADYFYLPLGPEDQPRATILLCDHKNNHNGIRRNVLFSDYHRSWMYESEFQTELKQPCNAAFAKALREAEGP